MGRNLVQWLTIASRKIRDGYAAKSYTWRMVMVPRPSLQAPLPCILITLSNGHKKIMLRVRSLEEYYEAFRLTVEEEEKIRLALAEANREANQIETDMRLLFEKRRMSPGEKWVNPETGEVIAEAERIIKEGNSGYRKD